MKPANQDMSYTMIYQSPLDTNYEDMQNTEIVPSKNFFTSVKPPKVEPRDLYNKVINDQL